MPLLHVSEQKHTIAKNESLRSSLLTKQLMIKLNKEPVLNAAIFMILIILNVPNVNSSFLNEQKCAFGTNMLNAIKVQNCCAHSKNSAHVSVRDFYF